MATPADLQAIMDAAEQAAASNDFPSAARHLREAATLQERTLGPVHPDLANTLNNLGVVCERIGEIDESERSFRRAYAIATTAFPADHEFVATSRANLEEFCRLHGRSFEQPAESKEPDAGGGSTKQDPPYERKIAEPAAVSIAPARGISFGVIAIVIGILLMIGLGWMAWRLTDTTHPVNATEVRELPKTAAPSDPTPPQPASPATPPAAPAPAAPPTVDPKPEPSPTPAPPPSSDSPTVVDARLCRNLQTSGAWECDPVTGEVGSGPVYFFTRVASTRDTTVQHRWYVGDRLHQNVMLSIQANGAGYRTYSRTTISPERAGEWRVELRTEDGRLLTEQRFTVR